MARIQRKSLEYKTYDRLEFDIDYMKRRYEDPFKFISIPFNFDELNDDLEYTTTNHLKFNVMNLIKLGIITCDTLAVYWHKGLRKIIISGKGSSKTFPTLCKMVLMLTQNDAANAVLMRKYKEQAASKLGDYIEKFFQDVSQYNFAFNGNWERTIRKFKRIRPGAAVTQSVELTSLEDGSSTDGSGPSNGGTVNLLFVDEPLVEEDVIKNNIETPREFESKEAVHISNLDRHNLSYAQRNKIPMEDRPKLERIYAGNNWGDHPLSMEMDEFLDDESWAEYVLGNPIDYYIGNQERINTLDLERLLENTYVTYWNKDEHNDTLYVKQTAFFNPINNLIEEQRNKLFSELKRALLEGNYHAITRIIGTKNKQIVGDEMKVFNIYDFNETTFEKMESAGYTPVEVSYGVDIDTGNKKFITIAPIVLFNKFGKDGSVKDERLFIDTIIEIPTQQLDDRGVVMKKLVKQIADAIYDYATSASVNHLDTSIIVDDFRKEFVAPLNNLVDDESLSSDMRKFLNNATIMKFTHKQGTNDLIARQDRIEIAYSDRTLWTSEGNGALIQDYKDCLKVAEYDKRRETKSAINYLDRIDAVDQGLYPFIWVIRNGG